MPQPFSRDSIVQFYFASPFNPVWGQGDFLCSHHYFVTILRTILFVTMSSAKLQVRHTLTRKNCFLVFSC